MPRLSRFVAVAVATSMTAGLLLGPGVAYAAGTVTSLSAKQMAAALKKVAAASKAAASGGWQMGQTFAEGGTSMTALMVVNEADGVMFEQIHMGKLKMTTYTVDHYGTYDRISDPASRAALTMMNRPDVQFTFTPDKKLTTVHDFADLSPGAMLTEGLKSADGLKHAGTKTLHNDGSVDYTVKSHGDTVTLSVGTDTTLTKLKMQSKEGNLALRFAYGVQPPDLPTPEETISDTELMQGLVYVEMSKTVKLVARHSATRARHAAHGHPVKVTKLRKAARHEAAGVNSAVDTKMIKVTNIHAGASLQATNPWTNKTVTYTVTAHGKKVTVHKK